jgi:hypothetical protein
VVLFRSGAFGCFVSVGLCEVLPSVFPAELRRGGVVLVLWNMYMMISFCKFNEMMRISPAGSPKKYAEVRNKFSMLKTKRENSTINIFVLQIHLI